MQMAEIWSWLTIVLNLVGLAVTLCLGFYLVTRGPRSYLAWFAALMLWATSGFLLHSTLYIHLPASGVLPHLRPLGILALALGFHVLLLLPRDPARRGWGHAFPPLLLPTHIRRWLGSTAEVISRAAMPLVYSLGIVLVLIGVFPSSAPSPAGTGSAVFLSNWSRLRLYPAVLAFLLILGVLSIVHLRQMEALGPVRGHRRYYGTLYTAVALALAGTFYLVAGVWLRQPIPGFPGELAMTAAAVVLGYVVARRNAERQGIALNRDLLYIALAIGSLTVAYVIIAELLLLGGHTPSTLIPIMIVIVAVSSLMLYDGLRTSLDRLFYREHFRQLRRNLRALSRETGIGQSLPERLQAILGGLCNTLGVGQGLIALAQDGEFVCRATAQLQLPEQTLAREVLAGNEIVDLPRPGLTTPPGLGLLVPIHADGNQVAALALGPKESGGRYSEEDLVLLDELADQLGAMIRTMRLQEENAQTISQMVSDFREQEHALQRDVQQMLGAREAAAQPVLEACAGLSAEEFASQVEDALRQLHDYSHLGEHALARLQIVDRQMEGRDPGFVTHLDRGKALSQVLVSAIGKLRPAGAEPKPQAIPSREWHPFLVLYAAYVLGDPNRDIMSRLYIGEGTFNRTRRRALGAVAKAVQEMEREAALRPA